MYGLPHGFIDLVNLKYNYPLIAKYSAGATVI